MNILIVCFAIKKDSMIMMVFINIIDKYIISVNYVKKWVKKNKIKRLARLNLKYLKIWKCY